MKNLLDDVKNGQWFCVKNNPKKIYKRIYDRVGNLKTTDSFMGHKQLLSLEAFRRARHKMWLIQGLSR